MRIDPSVPDALASHSQHLGDGLNQLRMPSRIIARLCAFLALAMLCTAAFVRADTVKLNDGTTLEGDILSENETQLTIEAQIASGTITKRETVNKADIIQIMRLTPEQKTQRAMEVAFRKLEEYQLDSMTSFPLSHYDQVINDVFHQFLIDYPGSPYLKAVQDKLAQWLAERDEVASGKAKYKGQWMLAAEAAKLEERDQLRHLLESGHQQLIDGHYSPALDEFKAIISTAKEPEFIDEAMRLYGETCRQWIAALERQRQPLTDEIKSYQERLTHSRQDRDEAESKLKSAISEQKSSQTYALGEEALVANARAAFDRARTEYDSTEAHLLELQNQLSAVQQQIAEVQTRSTAYTAGTAQMAQRKTEPASTASAATTNEPAQHAAPPVPQPAALDSIMGWVQQYWVYGAVAVVLGLWVVSRFFTR